MSKRWDQHPTLPAVIPPTPKYLKEKAAAYVRKHCKDYIVVLAALGLEGW